MKKQRLFILFIIIFIISGCSSHEVSDLSDTESAWRIVKTDTNQTFTFVPLYESYANYLNESDEASSRQVDQAKLEETVVQDMKDAADELNVALPFAYARPFFVPTPYKKALSERIDQLRTRETEIQRVIEQAARDSAKQLAGEDKVIFLAPLLTEFDDAVESMGGVTAFALEKDIIVILVREDVDLEMLAFVIAHEYHHTVLAENSEVRSTSLLDHIVGEGKADTFAKSLYPDVTPVWMEQLDPMTREQLMNQIATGQVNYAQLTNGDETLGVPRWSGYQIGGEIVNGYLNEHPDLGVEAWTNLPSEEMVKSSPYVDSFESGD